MPLFSFHDRSAREFIEGNLRRVAVGQCIQIDGRVFEQAFPSFEHNGAVWTPREAFLERRMGSAYGTWTCELADYGRTYTICHHEEQKERVYWSPDRKPTRALKEDRDVE